MPENIQPDPPKSPDKGRDEYADLAVTEATPERQVERIIKMVWEQGEDANENDPPTSLRLFVEGLDSDLNGFDANIVDYGDIKSMNAGNLDVGHPNQKTGLGEAFVRALGKVAKDAQCDDIEIEFYHAAALKHFIRVFGIERIQFRGTGVDQYNKVKYTFEEAAQIINERKAGATLYGKVNFRDMTPITAEVDLEGLDTRDWPMPANVDPTNAPWNQS